MIQVVQGDKEPLGGDHSVIQQQQIAENRDIVAVATDEENATLNFFYLLE